MKSLQELKDIGGFVDGTPQPREIAFRIDGKDYTATIHVKRLSIGEWERTFGSKEGKAAKSRTAHVIATLVTLGEDGQETLTVNDAATLAIPLAEAMLRAACEANGIAVEDGESPKN